MSNKEKKMLFPKLRFPEFRGASEWHPYVLEELEKLGWVELGRGEVISGQDVQAIPGDYPIYSSSVKNNGLMGKYGRFMFDEELISWSVDGGGNFFHRPKHKFSVTNVSGYMRIDTSHLNYRFVASQLQTLHASLTFDYQFKAHPSVIRKLYLLAIPASTEQRKIADCLSALDELIAAQAWKVEVLKTHKNGLMQRLFPLEGKAQPSWRFPEFQTTGEWEESKLINLSSEPLSNGVFNDPKKTGTGYKLINVSDMYIETTINERRLSLLELSSSEFQGNQVRTGDIFFTRSSLVKSGIAVSNIYLGSSSDVTYDGHLIRFRADPNKVIPLFAHYLFKSVPIRKQLIARGKTATMTTIGQADVATVKLFYPKLAEQQRIADCLTCLDDLIFNAIQEINSLKLHKKGLMQQLFPSTEGLAI